MDFLDRIGDTPVLRFDGDVPNGNTVLLKLECENPFGSHYDRVYLRLFEHYRRDGTLRPGCAVLETTSGSAGVSFAAIGRRLGYRCLVAIPHGGERAREEAIRREGAELIFTPADEYISGFPRFLRQFLAERKDVFFLNHSMGPRGTENKVALAALGTIARELVRQLGAVDCLVAAVGNGSSILGPGRLLPGTEIVAFEPFQSGVAYDLLYPGRYAETYGIEPGSLPRHRLPGTSFRGIDFPHIRLALRDERLVKEAVLVSDRRTDDQYWNRTGRDLTASLPHWDDQEAPFGRTTRAGIAVALRVAERVRGKNIVVLAYDKADRYDER